MPGRRYVALHHMQAGLPEPQGTRARGQWSYPQIARLVRAARATVDMWPKHVKVLDAEDRAALNELVQAIDRIEPHPRRDVS